MRFDIMTLFPDMVDGVLKESIIGRARAAGIITVRTHNIRDYSENKHRRVDDTPYGGGKGMLMAAPPIYNCYCAVKQEIETELQQAESENQPTREWKSRVIYLSPKGQILNQSIAKRLTDYDGLILLCGHYEGVDQRIVDEIVDEEISIGDYVLTSGNLPAMVIVDAVTRLLPGALGSPESEVDESFEDGLLEYPQYTRPAEYRGWKVPEVLLSGNHRQIAEWRRKEAQKRTELIRPDLLNLKQINSSED